MNVVIRPATRQDFEDWYQALPQRTLRAWVGEVDGKVEAIAGYVIHPHFVEAFSSIAAGRVFPSAIVYRNAVKLFAAMRRHGLPLIAVADPNIKNSGKFLERLGFTLAEKSQTGDIYTCT